MFMNFSKMIFLFFLFLGTSISISSNSWLGAWMGLEINLMAFIPLMMNLNNMLMSEAALKYFLIQALASSIFLFSIILGFLHSQDGFLIEIDSLNQILINMALFIKMGAAPFHFWFPSVMESLDWINGLILMTWQKIAPLMLISYTINFNFFIFVIISSALIGSIGGLNQTNLRTLMAYSSINHISWMLSSMFINENLWMTYYLFYVFLSLTIVFFCYNFQIFFMNQLYSLMNANLLLKFMLLTNLLSLGGLPPFLGFMPKLLVIQLLTNKNMYFLVFILIMASLITLFFYIRVTFSAFMLMYPSLKWNKLSIWHNLNWTLLLSSISLFGFSGISLVYNFI
uniref:NADH-ubiquinone oxidoreductase chain 2 n=2 Tax=Protochauliodes biconicus TaxID=1452981 RepID=A0A343DRC7_9NEOP|nr:NADH dehydrogenase subunit 2 [Protochauliodes biconicus]